MEEEHDIYPPKIRKYGQIYKPSTGNTEYTNENYYIYQNGRQESRTLYTTSNWDLTNEENYSQRGVYEENPYTSNYGHGGRERENFENYRNSRVNGYSTDVHDTLPESTEIYDHGHNSLIARESAPPWIQMLSPDPSKPQNGNRSSFRLPTRIDLKEPVFPVPKDSDSDVSSEQATPRRITKTRLILFITICVILIAGVSAVSIILTRLSETDKYSYYESSIKLALDQNYSADLGNKESDAFKNFSKEFCLSVQDAFVSDNSSYKDSYQGCIVDQLSEGSIVVQFRIIFSIVTTTSINNDTVSAILVQGLANGSSFAVIAISVQVSVSNIQGSSDPLLQVNMFVYVQVLSEQTTTEITSTRITTTTNMTDTTANYSDTTEAITTTLAEETTQTTDPITTTSAETTQTMEAITTSATETSQTTEEMTTSVAETTQTTEEMISAAETTQTTEDMTTSVAETTQTTEEMTTSAAETTQTTEEMTTSAVEITQTTEPITTTSATGTTQTTESMTTKSAAETTQITEAMTTAAAETTQTTEPTTITSVADTTQTTKSMTTNSAVEITNNQTINHSDETTAVSSSTAQNTEWLITETTVTALSTEASTETTMSTISHSTKDMSTITEVPTLSSTTIETTYSTMGNLTTKGEVLTSSEEMTTTPEVLTTSTPGDTTTTPEVLTSSTPGDTTTTPVVLTTSTPEEMSTTPEVVTSSTLGDTTTTPEVLTSSTPGDTTTTSDVMTTSTPVEMTTTPEVVTSSTPGDTATTPDVLTTFTPEEMTTTPELMTTSTPEEMTTTPEVLASSTPGDTTTTTEVPTSIPLNLTTTTEVLSSTSEITTLTISATTSEALVKRSTTFSTSTTVQSIPTTTDVQTSLHSEETTTVSSSIASNTEELTTATSMSNITTDLSTETTTETTPVTSTETTPDTTTGNTSVTTDGQTNDTTEMMSTTTEESLSGSTDTFTPTQNDTTTETISSTTATSNDTATATMSTVTNESMISTTEVLSTTTPLEETTSMATSDPMVTAVSMNTYSQRAPVGGIGSFVCTVSNTNKSGSVVKIKRQLNDTTIATINSSGIFIAPDQENKFSAEVSQNGGDIETRFNITSITCGDEGTFVCCLEKDNATWQSPAFELSVYADPSNVELTLNADFVADLARAGEQYNHICKGNIGYPSNTSYLGVRLKKSSGDGEFVYSEATTKESDKNTNNSNFQWTVKLSENETMYVVSDVITGTCTLTQQIKFLLEIESSWNNGIIECFVQEWNDQQNVSVSKEINLIPGNYCTGEGNKKKYHPDGCNKWVTCYNDYPYGSSCSDATLCYDIHNGRDYCENCDQVFCEPEPTTTTMPTTTQYSAAYVTCIDTEASINDSSAVIRCNVTSEAFTTINITRLSQGSGQEVWVASVSFNGDVVMNTGIDDVVTFNMANNPKKLNVEVRNIDCTDRGQYIFRTLGAANYSSQNVEFRVKASPGAVTQTVNADLVEEIARAGDRYNHICKGDIGYPTGRAYVGIRLTKSGGEQFIYSEEATSASDIDKSNPTQWTVSILGTGTLYIAGDTTSGICTLTQEIKYLLQLDSSWDDGTMECFVHDRQSNTDTAVSADIALIPANYCAGETNNAIKTHPGGCNKWVVCSGGNPFGWACTDLNLCYNRNKGYCESCDQVTCGS